MSDVGEGEEGREGGGEGDVGVEAGEDEGGLFGGAEGEVWGVRGGLER